MVATAEAAGTRTVALLTDMGSPWDVAPATGSSWLRRSSSCAVSGTRKAKIARTFASSGRLDVTWRPGCHAGAGLRAR